MQDMKIMKHKQADFLHNLALFKTQQESILRYVDYYMLNANAKSCSYHFALMENKERGWENQKMFCNQTLSGGTFERKFPIVIGKSCTDVPSAISREASLAVLTRKYISRMIE